MDIPNIRPTISDGKKALVRLYGGLFLAVLILFAGISMLISGVTVLPMMAISGSISGVVISAVVLSAGGILAGASYLWLTGPV